VAFTLKSSKSACLYRLSNPSQALELNSCRGKRRGGGSDALENAMCRTVQVLRERGNARAREFMGECPSALVHAQRLCLVCGRLRARAAEVRAPASAREENAAVGGGARDRPRTLPPQPELYVLLTRSHCRGGVGAVTENGTAAVTRWNTVLSCPNGTVVAGILATHSSTSGAKVSRVMPARGVTPSTPKPVSGMATLVFTAWASLPSLATTLRQSTRTATVDYGGKKERKRGGKTTARACPHPIRCTAAVPHMHTHAHTNTD
jgi:hypothetical protein